VEDHLQRPEPFLCARLPCDLYARVLGGVDECLQGTVLQTEGHLHVWCLSFLLSLFVPLFSLFIFFLIYLFVIKKQQ